MFIAASTSSSNLISAAAARKEWNEILQLFHSQVIKSKYSGSDMA